MSLFSLCDLIFYLILFHILNINISNINLTISIHLVEVDLAAFPVVGGDRLFVGVLVGLNVVVGIVVGVGIVGCVVGGFVGLVGVGALGGVCVEVGCSR